MFSKLKISQGEERPACPWIWVSPFLTPLLQVGTTASPEGAQNLKAVTFPGSLETLKLRKMILDPHFTDGGQNGRGEGLCEGQKGRTGGQIFPCSCLHVRKNICPTNSLKVSL